jgi:hypothetical protein
MRFYIKVIGGLLIVALVGGVVVTGIASARRSADAAACRSCLRQLYLGVHTFHDVRRKLPLACVPNENLPLEKKFGLMYCLVFFMTSRMDLNGKVPNQTIAWDAEENLHIAKDPIPILGCPATPHVRDGFFLANYVGLAGVGKDAAFLAQDDPRVGAFGYTRQLRYKDITDGKENTVAFAETATDNGPWVSAGPATLRGLEGFEYLGSTAPFSTNHHLGMWSRTPALHMAFLDGSVRAFSYDLAPKLFEALVTVAAGDQVPPLD